MRDNPQVRERLPGRFKRIFVDEFQDTDPLQAEILLLLAADDPGETDWRASRPVPGRLFLVGDPKQSIYRFRRADVAIYRDVCRAARARRRHARPPDHELPQRARDPGFVNAAFAPVMTGDDADTAGGLRPARAGSSALPDQPSIVALPVPEPYARRYVTGRAIEQSLPDAVGAFIDWIINQSGWTVTERSGGGRSRSRRSTSAFCSAVS